MTFRGNACKNLQTLDNCRKGTDFVCLWLLEICYLFDYKGQFGWPSVSIAGTCGMLAGVIASVMESIGDYYACALQSDAGKPPSHAINRGDYLLDLLSILPQLL